MSALVYVEFQITEGRESDFNRIFANHLQAVSAWPGFVALRQLRETEPPSGAFCLLLEFVDHELLSKWRTSDSHLSLAKMYRECCEKPPTVKVMQEL